MLTEIYVILYNDPHAGEVELLGAYEREEVAREDLAEYPAYERRYMTIEEVDFQ